MNNIGTTNTFFKHSFWNKKLQIQISNYDTNKTENGDFHTDKNGLNIKERFLLKETEIK
jgi:hypothetical protein